MHEARLASFLSDAFHMRSTAARPAFVPLPYCIFLPPVTSGVSEFESALAFTAKPHLAYPYPILAPFIELAYITLEHLLLSCLTVAMIRIGLQHTPHL